MEPKDKPARLSICIDCTELVQDLRGRCLWRSRDRQLECCTSNSQGRTVRTAVGVRANLPTGVCNEGRNSKVSAARHAANDHHTAKEVPPTKTACKEYVSEMEGCAAVPGLVHAVFLEQFHQCIAHVEDLEEVGRQQAAYLTGVLGVCA